MLTLRCFIQSHGNHKENNYGRYKKGNEKEIKVCYYKKSSEHKEYL